MAKAKSENTEFRTYFSRVRLRNVKCYRDSGDIHLKPLTIILGPNNSGKSTILNSFQLLSQTAASPNASNTLITSGPLVDVGSYYDLLHRGEANEDKKIEFEFELKFTGGSPFDIYTAESRRSAGSGAAVLRVRYWFDRKESRPRFDSVTLLRDGKVKIAYRRVRGKLVVDTLPAGLNKYLTVQAMHFVPSFHWSKPPPRRSSARIGAASNAAFSFAYAWNQVFSGIRYVAPLRSAVPRFGLVGRTSSGHPGEGGEALLRMLKDQRYVYRANKDLLHLLQDWVCKRLELLRSLELVPLDRDKTVLKLIGEDPEGFGQVNLASMGEGFSQLLPILANVLGAGYDQCVLVEQPEIHLHPRLQAELGDLFVDQVQRGNAHQFLIETHSEHLLLRIRRRIADGTIPVERVAVLVVERVGGRPRIRELKLKGNGQFVDWPTGFFEEGYQEALGLMLAGRKRKVAA